MCLHMAFAYLAHYILHRFGDVYLQWGNNTIAFTFQGVSIDLCVSWAKADSHSHVVLSKCLRQNLTQQTANACKQLLQSAREHGIAQPLRGPKAFYLKTVVLSLLLVAVQQSEPDFHLHAESSSLISLADLLI